MREPLKERVVWGEHLTRKDFRHTSKGYFMSYYGKKRYRDTAQNSLREKLKRLDWLPQNGEYRKIEEVQWNVI